MEHKCFSLLLVLWLSTFSTSLPQRLWDIYVKSGETPAKKEHYFPTTALESSGDHSGDGEEDGTYEGSGGTVLEDDEDLGSGVRPYLPKDGGYIGFGIVPYTIATSTPHYTVTLQEGGKDDGDYLFNKRVEKTTIPTESRVGDGGVKEKPKFNIPFWETDLKRHWNSGDDTTNSFGVVSTTFFKNIGNNFQGILDKALSSLPDFKGLQTLSQRINEELDKAMNSTLMKNLINYFSRGNETVSKFFQDIGTKIEEWRKQRNQEGVDGDFLNTMTKDQYEKEDILQDPGIHQKLSEAMTKNILSKEEDLTLTRPEITEFNGIIIQRKKV